MGYRRGATRTVSRATRPGRSVEGSDTLYSSRAQPAPEEQRSDGRDVPTMKDSRPVTGVSDVIRFGLEHSVLPPSVIEACREIVAANRGSGVFQGILLPLSTGIAALKEDRDNALFPTSLAAREEYI